MENFLVLLVFVVGIFILFYGGRRWVRGRISRIPHSHFSDKAPQHNYDSKESPDALSLIILYNVGISDW